MGRFRDFALLSSFALLTVSISVTATSCIKCPDGTTCTQACSGKVGMCIDHAHCKADCWGYCPADKPHCADPCNDSSGRCKTEGACKPTCVDCAYDECCTKRCPWDNQKCEKDKCEKCWGYCPSDKPHCTALCNDHSGRCQSESNCTPDCVYCNNDECCTEKCPWDGQKCKKEKCEKCWGYCPAEKPRCTDPCKDGSGRCKSENNCEPDCIHCKYDECCTEKCPWNNQKCKKEKCEKCWGYCPADKPRCTDLCKDGSGRCKSEANCEPDCIYCKDDECCTEKCPWDSQKCKKEKCEKCWGYCPADKPHCTDLCKDGSGRCKDEKNCETEKFKYLKCGDICPSCNGVPSNPCCSADGTKQVCCKNPDSCSSTAPTCSNDNYVWFTGTQNSPRAATDCS